MQEMQGGQGFKPQVWGWDHLGFEVSHAGFEHLLLIQHAHPL